jgi:hypothetical protein
MIEKFIDIPNYEGMYQVSNIGNVKSFKHNREKLLQPLTDKNGYYCVNLWKNSERKTFRVHQLVAIAFLEHTPNMYNIVVNHKDLNKQNNSVENLELISQRENSNKKHLKTSSKYTGVTFHKKAKKWVANIRIKGLKKYIGLFKTEYEAHLAYQQELNNL